MKVIKGGKVLVAKGEIIENGTVVIEDGKILDVGVGIEAPAGAEVIDAKGCWVTPGLIDVHTHLMGFPSVGTMPGLNGDFNEVSDPITPHIRAIDALDPFDIGVERARMAGFTTCYTGPGSANIIGGLGCAVKLRGRTAEEMFIEGTEQMKFALGENPKRVYGHSNRAPVTRMAVAGMLREALTKARAYAEDYRKFEAGGGEKPKFDAKCHSLMGVVEGTVRCRIHCHRADDIMTAIRIGREFGLDFTLEHATEGWRIADIIARENVVCVVGPFTIGPLKQEVWNSTHKTPAIYEKAGVEICLTADAGFGTQYLPVYVGMLMRYGLSEKTAFMSVTETPARVMGLQGRIGSIEKGKDADIAVFDGHPFSNMTKCRLTIIDGEVFENTLFDK